jgi:hypothetical protein
MRTVEPFNRYTCWSGPAVTAPNPGGSGPNCAVPCRAVSPFTILENVFLSPNPLPCNYLYIVSNFCLHGNKFGPGLFLVASRLMRTVQKTRHPPKPTREPVYAVSLLGWGQVEVEKMKKKSKRTN